MPSPIRIPRIKPAGDHMDHMVGIWELDGQMVCLLAEPETGVLVAMTTYGTRVNPMHVVSHGAKMNMDAPQAAVS